MQKRFLRVSPVLAAAVVLSVFSMLGDSYYTGRFAKIMIYAVFALSLELLVGTTNLVCFGHADPALPGDGYSTTSPAIALK